MASLLSNHPFGVEAWFDYSIVLTYALPKSVLEPLIPPCLELDVFDEQWAFLAVAMVKTKRLRPSGFPRFLGKDFFLIGYRVFVRYHNAAGKRLRGLFILKSETDKRSMSLMGSIFSRYRYSTIDIDVRQDHSTITIASKSSDLHVVLDTKGTDVALPKGSPFASWQQARRFAGPLPFTLSYDTKSEEVLIVEGQRENWQPKPIEVKRHSVGYLTKLGLEDAQLASAFIVEQIPYHWKKGRLEKWQQ